MRKLLLILVIASTCLVSMGQSVVMIKDEVAAECECLNPNARGEGTVFVFDCRGDGIKFTLDIPIADYPPMWAAPPLRKFHHLGKATDGKLHFLKTPATACDDEHPAARFQKPNINGCEPKFPRN